MPIVTATPRGQGNGQVVTEFIDSVGTTSVTYTYPKTQELIAVRNIGTTSITVTTGGESRSIKPGEQWEKSGSFNAFSIIASSGVQAFEARSDEEGSSLDAPDFKTLSRRGNIVCIGDSITAGVGGAQNYPLWLATRQGIKVTNVGVAGVVINYHITNADAYLSLSPRPDIAVVLIGTNNFGGGQTVDQTKSDYKRFIQLLVNNGITPILCTLLPRSDNVSLMTNILTFNEWLREYASVYGFIVADTYSTFANTDSTPKAGYLSDGLHPTVLGHTRLAETIDRVLPIRTTDTPWTVPGGPNYITNPTFTTDADANGRGDGWSQFANGGVTATSSLVAHPTDGNWQQVARSGGTDGNSLTYVYQLVTLPGDCVPGDTVVFGGDVDTDTLAGGAVQIELTAQWQTSAGAFISAFTALPKCGIQIINKRFIKQMVIPATAAKLNILLTTYGVGSSTYRYGRMMLKKVQPL